MHKESKTPSCVLLIDFGGQVPVLAMACDGTVTAARRFEDRSASARWLSALSELLSSEGCTLNDLSGVAVTTGPGSFTGIRTGLAAAKGLCEAANLPLAAVSSLELLAYAAGKPGHVAAVLDAGRGAFYVRLAGSETESPREMLTGREGLELLLSGRSFAVAEESLSVRLVALHPDRIDVRPEHLLEFAERKWAAGEDDRARVEANYVRSAADIYKQPVGPSLVTKVAL